MRDVGTAAAPFRRPHLGRPRVPSAPVLAVEADSPGGDVPGRKPWLVWGLCAAVGRGLLPGPGVLGAMGAPCWCPASPRLPVCQVPT